MGQPLGAQPGPGSEATWADALAGPLSSGGAVGNLLDISETQILPLCAGFLKALPQKTLVWGLDEMTQDRRAAPPGSVSPAEIGVVTHTVSAKGGFMCHLSPTQGPPGVQIQQGYFE